MEQNFEIGNFHSLCVANDAGSGIVTERSLDATQWRGGSLMRKRVMEQRHHEHIGGVEKVSNHLDTEFMYGAHRDQKEMKMLEILYTRGK